MNTIARLHTDLATLPVAELLPYARNARTHSQEQIAQIAASIREFGFTSPVLIDEAGGIIAGHGRAMAARHLGLSEVPCLRLMGLSEAQKRAYIIADNKLAINAGWDESILAAELQDLKLDGFDLNLTGFDTSELDALFDDADDGGQSGSQPGSEQKFNYQEKYAVLIWCENEQAQIAAFDKLVGMGYVCKVLVN